MIILNLLDLFHFILIGNSVYRSILMLVIIQFSFLFIKFWIKPVFFIFIERQLLLRSIIVRTIILNFKVSFKIVILV